MKLMMVRRSIRIHMVNKMELKEVQMTVRTMSGIRMMASKKVILILMIKMELIFKNQILFRKWMLISLFIEIPNLLVIFTSELLIVKEPLWWLTQDLVGSILKLVSMVSIVIGILTKDRKGNFGLSIYLIIGKKY